ncbi:hypothetical protein TNCV_3494961 [Trichonephila clavipes]|nr:hypothetical protein TNCV_3494961 [Trichonephila clavipes]
MGDLTYAENVDMHCMYGVQMVTEELRYESITRSFLFDECLVTGFFIDVRTYLNATFRTKGLHRNVGASRFNGPYSRQGCVLARTVESNQGGRFDGNESVVDSFRSGAVNFKTHVHAISRAFPSYVCQKNLPSGKRTRCPGSPRSTPFLSDKYHPCKF